jgi:2,3-bisphosphoglycerate-independent phosphoglycerate mutase
MPKKNNVALIILDGYGCRSEKKGNAISVAKKPNIDLLFKSYPNIQIAASGEAVGLPVGQMGNSEVGHLNIGAGRIIYTGLSIVDKKITDQEFAKNQAFNKAFNHVKKNHSRLHIIGLFSDGGVHSSLSHILEMIKVCENNKIPTVIHPFTDGRDSLPNSFLTQY